MLTLGLPDQLRIYLEAVRLIKFDETPNYKELINIFEKGFGQNHLIKDDVFDWVETKNKAVALYNKKVH